MSSWAAAIALISTYHPVAPGSNPKHTIKTFFFYKIFVFRPIRQVLNCSVEDIKTYQISTFASYFRSDTISGAMYSGLPLIEVFVWSRNTKEGHLSSLYVLIIT